MSEAEMKVAAERLEEIGKWKSSLRTAELELRLINEHVKAGKTWKPTILLREGDRYSYNQVAVEFSIPAGMLQQQAINKVLRLENKITSLGGSL